MNSSENLQQMQKNLESMDVGVIQKYLEGMVPNLLAFAVQVIIAIILYMIGVRIIRVARKLLRKALEKSGIEEGIMTFLDSLTRIVLYAILILSIGGTFGIATSSVIAVIGSAGLTAGLALQGSLSNFAGGILILLLKPFKVGDYIIEDTNKNEGKVQEITIFYTKLTTVDNQVVVIPNGTLANTSLTNVTHQEERLVRIKVGISYQADIRQAKAVLEDVLAKEPKRIPDLPVQVFVDELADSSVVLGCRVWVSAEEYWNAKWRLNEEMKLALDAAGIEIPYQQLDVNIRQ